MAERGKDLSQNLQTCLSLLLLLLLVLVLEGFWPLKEPAMECWSVLGSALLLVSESAWGSLSASCLLCSYVVEQSGLFVSSSDAKSGGNQD